MHKDEPRRSEPAAYIEHRRFGRGGVHIDIEVRELGGGRHKAQMIDLSQSGCRICSVTYLNESKTVFIALPDFAPLQAEVVWKIRDDYGCAFANALHPAVYDHILARYPSLDR